MDEAIILAATDGVRMRPLTELLPKVLLPVRLEQKPILFFHLDDLVREGVKHCIITLEPRLGPQVACAVRQYMIGRDMDITFLYQQRRGGLGYAILECESSLRSPDGFILLLGDEHNTATDFYNITRKILSDRSASAVIGVRIADTESSIRGTASLSSDSDGRVRSYHEKPSGDLFGNGMCTSGRFWFNPEFFASLARCRNDPATFINGEHSIGASISDFISRGRYVFCAQETGSHIHLTTIADYISARV